MTHTGTRDHAFEAWQKAAAEALRLTAERDAAREQLVKAERERDAERSLNRIEADMRKDAVLRAEMAAEQHQAAEQIVRELVEALRPFALCHHAPRETWAPHCRFCRAWVLVEKYGATASPSPPHPAANTSAEGDD